MHVIDLPIVDPKESLARLEQGLQAANVSAVVVCEDGDLERAWLVTAGEIATASHLGLSSLAEVPRLRPAPLIPKAFTETHQMSYDDPLATPELFGLLATNGFYFALVGSTGDHARIVGLHEDGLHLIGAGADRCYCLNPRWHHAFGRPHPTACPMDNYPVVC